MRTNFFIILLVILSYSVAAQNKGRKPPKPATTKEGRLASPDMSVINGDNGNKVGQPAVKPGDTSNIIPPVNYSKLSFGLNYGLPFFAGDVPMDVTSAGYGGYIKYSFNHVMGIRAQYLQGKIYGATSNSNTFIDSTKFVSNISNINLQLIFNVGSVDYRNSFPRNNFYFGVGIGMQINNASKNVPDSVKITNNRSYTGNNVTLPLSFGFKRKITKNFDVGAEVTLILSGNNMIDLTNTGALPDLVGYGLVSVVYNLTTAKKPKHIDWSNPINKIYMDLMEATDKANAMKNDADKDGIPDALDQEPNTKPGYKVDSKGVTLDSDNDGIPDTIDPDPNGFKQLLGLYFPTFNDGVDSSGKGYYEFNDSVPHDEFVTISKSGYGLPSISFPPNGFTMHVEQFNLLQQVARILMIDTSASLVIIGHADNNKPNLTQLTLAERRALEVKRKLFKIYELDEKRLLVFSEKDPYIQKYQLSTEGLNRKVEFKIIRRKR
ncbi:MAG: hypothetical protein H7296_06605 [Bacteroidia bacterium]|nr:hypothetical protein [Bacteroidia bacterium]